MPEFTLAVEDAGSPDARRLIAQLDRYLTSLYPPQSNHLLSVDSLRQPNVTLLVLRVDGKAAGCGAYLNHGGKYAEIKRMFVLPEFRGLGLGRRILEGLEARIEASGLAVARLETGVDQPEALRLYEKSGFTPCEPFGDYKLDPLSIFMEKSWQPITQRT